MDTPHRKFSLELLANLAVRLLRDDDDDYHGATGRAYKLLDACWFRLDIEDEEERRKEEDSRIYSSARGKWNSILFGETTPLTQKLEAFADSSHLLARNQKELAPLKPWKKAVMSITGKPDESKATGAFKKFWAKKSSEPSDSIIAKFRKSGMNTDQIKYLRRLYQAMPRCAPRKIPKKPLGGTSAG
jgi:hypothetical protein